MTDKKILVLSTYPIAGEALHGGQKRAKAMVEHYRNTFGEAKYIAIFHKKFTDEYGPEDIPIEDPKIIDAMDNAALASDLMSGEAIYKDASVKRKLKKAIAEYRPDVIQVEQIYPFAGIMPLLQEMSFKPKILVLSSQNDETRLKKDIFSGIDMPEQEKQAFIRKISSLEKRASRECDLVVAVNDSDARWHKKLGAKKCIVIPNGISKITPTPAALRHWKKFKKEHGIDSLATFVGSAHPPNLFGFKNMIGTDLSFLPKRSGIALAGGVSHYIQGDYGIDAPWAKKFWKRAWPLGKLSDDNLAGLIQESDVMLLPIVSGVGSNLKTAEAILADKKIVATRLAFRTFEKYDSLPNIWFADNIEDFKKAVMVAMRSKKMQRSEEESTLAGKVQWQYGLEPLSRTLEIMVDGFLRTALRRLRHQMGALKRHLF
ncbi:MAG TPA: glycosyltransferase [Candidatus Saccharimonadales bacterium]|nr:glycosyltransferase [Candidatus Saccharimonadales bacterium]